MSSKDVLSEGELDALMESVAGGDVSLDSSGQHSDCQLFDFNTREQALLAQMPALNSLNEKHCLALVQSIAQLYKISAHVEVEKIQLVKLDQAIAAIKVPSGINLLEIAPLNGVSFLVLPGELLSFLVEKFFGGTFNSANASSNRKSITPTEKRINDVVTEKFFTTLKEAWKEKVALTPQLAAFETNPDFLQAGSPDDVALLFSFVVTVEDWKSSIDWIVPYAALEPLRPKLGNPKANSKPQKVNTNWASHFCRELQFVDLEVSGTFISRPVSIAEVLSLGPGSIVPLKTPSEVTVYIENLPFSTGEHGVLNGSKSIKIKEIISNEVDPA